MTAALTLSGIEKRFGAVVANRGVSLEVAAGTVHAVVGENGAGKSTLMKIAYGHARADGGTIAIKGEEVDRERYGPREAIARGVGMVHQHFMLVPALSVVENVVLGREPGRRGRLELAPAAAELAELSRRFGFEIDPRARVEELTVGERQRVEILKVLWRGCDLLILDEPTAVLTPGEARRLIEVLRGLVKEGLTVVLVTHKLDEVAGFADRITVMRRGEVAAELEGEGASAEEIARAMVGRPVLLQVEKEPANPGENVLEVKELVVPRERGGAAAVDGVSFAVRAGEIVGVAGVVGNGQSELVEAIAGLRRPLAGSIAIAGARGDRRRAVVAHVPEDRHARGLVLDFSVEENLVLGRQRDFTRLFGLDRRRIREEAGTRIAEADLRPPDPEAPARALSGGNQQKIVVARELARARARLLLCAQPTRGVDIGAIELIHKRIVAARDGGMAVLLVSAELTELAALADRVLVFYRGRIAAELDGDELQKEGAFERLGRLMTGLGTGDAAEGERT